MNSQANQAKNPLNDLIGKSSTALYLEMIAALPLFLYLKAITVLACSILFKFLPSSLPC